MSLIECGPVNTDFLANLQKAEVEDVCQNLDKQTLGLYEKYLQHCNFVFQNSAQDTEEIVKVCGEGQNRFAVCDADGTFLAYFIDKGWYKRLWFYWVLCVLPSRCFRMLSSHPSLHSGTSPAMSCPPSLNSRSQNQTAHDTSGQWAKPFSQQRKNKSHVFGFFLSKCCTFTNSADFLCVSLKRCLRASSCRYSVRWSLLDFKLAVWTNESTCTCFQLCNIKSSKNKTPVTKSESLLLLWWKFVFISF